MSEVPTVYTVHNLQYKKMFPKRSRICFFTFCVFFSYGKLNSTSIVLLVDKSHLKYSVDGLALKILEPVKLSSYLFSAQQHFLILSPRSPWIAPAHLQLLSLQLLVQTELVLINYTVASHVVNINNLRTSVSDLLIRYAKE